MPTPADLFAFEREYPTHDGAKMFAIHDRFGISAPRYYLLLDRAAVSPEGISVDPGMARWLRERGALRAGRRARRMRGVTTF